MYTIIGGDGKEYGPVTAEQVRSWIAGGRANMETKIKAAGSDVWKTVAAFPEITGAAPGGPASGLVSPHDAAQAPAPAAAAPLDIIRCYERSWALLKANFWPMVGVSILMALICGVLGYSQYAGLFFISPLFGGVLSGGFYYYFLLRIRGQPATVGDYRVRFRDVDGYYFA